MFPFLRNRGYYVVEDLQTNFGELAQHYKGNARISCVEYLKKLLDLRVAHEQMNIANEDDPFLHDNGATCINVDRSDESYIQGFAFQAADDVAKQIRYRARLVDGSWTNWVFGNAFIGSRGMGANLTGFSLEISGDLRDRYDIVAAGAFSGSGDVVAVGNGQHCFPTNSVGFLRAIQLLIKTKGATLGTAGDRQAAPWEETTYGAPTSAAV